VNEQGDADEVLHELAQIAADTGAAIVPVGHDDLLRSTTELTQRLFDAAACSVALLEAKSDQLVFRSASGAGAARIVGQRLPVGQGIAGWVVSSGQPIGIAEVARDPRFARGVAEATGYVPSSILAVPLETEREMLGVIEVLDPGERAPVGAQGMEILVLLARQTALAIESVQVFGDVGRALFAAAATTSTSTTVSDSLLEMARSMGGPHAGVVELAGYLGELGRFGDEEQLAATAMIRSLVTYVKSRATVR
jgi:GAF domain-containing protein